MKNYSIVCICQVYNELRKGNLERFVRYILPLVEHLVVYDDSSTDGSYEFMLEKTPYVIRGTKNDFANEQSHKQLLLQEALKLDPDFILWLDADEVLTTASAEVLQELCKQCDQNQMDAVNMHEINLWRSYSWQRLDSSYDAGWFCRLWRVVPGMCLKDIKPGLHRQLFPSTIRAAMWTLDIQVLHYGFSSKQRLAYKYLIYRAHGQRGYAMLDRLISEEKLVVKKVPQEFFPEGLWVDDEEPKPLPFAESLAYVEEYREEVFKPRFSIVCLIYKNVEWLKFIYEQVFKYTDMTDKEFFFVANDASLPVLNYLKENYIPHHIFSNTPQQQKDWYINNIYRAYNFAATKARGDFIVFVNSDMAFTPGWFENLWQAYNGANCVSPRLVESGKLPSGQYGVEKDFGMDYPFYQESNFQNFASELKEFKLEDGGLFIPLLIRKEHFWLVNGFPEGNVRVDSDLNDPTIARQGEACIVGKNALMYKLDGRGIKHQTAFDSLVYHFQRGELDSLGTVKTEQGKIRVAVCNDTITGSMGEKIIWDFLLESLPASVGIDRNVAGIEGDFASNIQKFIQTNYPDVEIIIQNSTFNIIDASRYTIGVLQDDFRSMGSTDREREDILQKADKLVTDSLQTALSYPEYDFEIIPMGEDSNLDSMQKWYSLLTSVSQKLMDVKAKNIPDHAEEHKVSIIITTFQRAHLLRLGLESLSRQTMPFNFETIVVNDGLLDETEEICYEFKEKLNLKYIFSGQRNLSNEPVWRVPGFAINIGVKQSSGDLLVLCCAEMFHINNTIARLTEPILNNPKLLGIPIGKDDQTGAYLEHVNKNEGSVELAAALYNSCTYLNTKMPFLLALHRSQFLEIGGYDEDFLGMAYDDNDFIDRLLGNGCRYCQTDAVTVHLYHSRPKNYYEPNPPEWEYNRKLYHSRIGKIVRNENREWGIL